MKTKKGIITIVILIIIVLLVIVGIYMMSSKSNVQRKGFDILGNDYCDGNHNKFAGDALTPWTCKLCGYSAVNPDTDVPVICNSCANLTGRCMECGKLEK